jgi:hypothetical protein
MRLDLPREPEIPLTRDRDIDPPETTDTRRPERHDSPLDRRLPLLHQQAEERQPRTVEIPHDERRRDREPDQRGRKREREVRPRHTREGIAVEIRGIRLRQEEQALLGEVGRFRVLNLKDVARTIYGGNERAMRSDLEYLREHKLISVDSVAPRNDGHWLPQKRIEVVTLSREGVRLAQETNNFSQEQMLYHDLVQLREVEHDSQIYGAYRKEAERIKESGGSNFRVELDYELKSKVQKAIHAARKVDPGRDMDEIKREVAGQYELPYVHNKIEIPDARIHYDTDQGARTAFSDIEVVTAAYRPGHIAAKAQAGFHMYASASDHSRLSKIEDEHHMLDWVMDL